MARRYHEIKGLAEFTAKTIVSSEEDWKRFLYTAGHTFESRIMELTNRVASEMAPDIISEQLSSKKLYGVANMYPDVSACHVIIYEDKYVDNILLGCF